ncbi:MAG: DUF5989 family protein [Verrucomicrobiales bacterium]
MSDPKSKFEEAAREGAGEEGMISEFVSFLKENKKWWLAPIIVILLVFGILIVLAGTGAAPFIYTLF